MTSDHFKAGITVTLFYQSEISTLVEECENVKTNFETNKTKGTLVHEREP